MQIADIETGGVRVLGLRCRRTHLVGLDAAMQVPCSSPAIRSAWKTYVVSFLALGSVVAYATTRATASPPPPATGSAETAPGDAPSRYEMLIGSNFGPDNKTQPRRSKTRRKRDEKKEKLARKRAVRSGSDSNASADDGRASRQSRRRTSVEIF